MKTKLLALTLAAFLTGCVTEREVVYKTIRFANTNGVTTAIYYPKTMEKGLKTPHDVERWRHIASKIAPDDGAAKEMKLFPIDLSMDNPHPHILNQKQWSDEYHQEHPECTHLGGSFY
jgi:hypothetical protein